MNPATFFEDCDKVMDGGEATSATNESQNSSSDSLELMDIFALMDDPESESVPTQENNTESVNSNEIRSIPVQPVTTAPAGVTIENTTIKIMPQTMQSLDDCASIKELVIAYFGKYGTSSTASDFKQYVMESFEYVFPYCEKYGTYLKRLQCILLAGYGVGLSLEALEQISVSTKLYYKKLTYSKRLVGLAEVEILQQCSEEELNFLRKYSLSEDLTEGMLSLYRAEGATCLAKIFPYLGNKDVLKAYVNLCGLPGFKDAAFASAASQNCINKYAEALHKNDTVTEILIESRTYNKVKDSLDEIDKSELIRYKDYEYLETIVTLLDSGFCNIDFIDSYLKEKNEIGDYLAGSYDMYMLKLLNQGCDIHHAILAKIYKIANLEFKLEDFEKNKESFSKLALVYIRGTLELEDVLLQTSLLLLHSENILDVSQPIRDALYNFVMDHLVVTNSPNKNQSNSPEVYQLIAGKSSYVFNVYDFCNHYEDVMHVLSMFKAKRKNVKVYRTTPEICIILFSNEGGTNFVTGDRKYSCSLKNWCKGAYDKAGVYTMEQLSTLNSLTVLAKYKQSFTVSDADYKATGLWIKSMHDAGYAMKVDLVMDYLLKNPKSMQLLLSENRQVGIAALSRVLDLTGFQQAFYFLIFLAKGVCNKDPKCSITTQRQPNRAEIIIKSKKRGNKLCTFDTIFAETTFQLLVNELKEASSVKISYTNSIVIECEKG